MSNKKQTAVEWLAETLKFSNKEIYAQTYYIIEKAKEMDKQQKIDAYNQGEFNQGCNGSAEDYIKETYGE
jgi:hypothetical protein